MHEIPAWQIDMLLAGLNADEHAATGASVDDELRADPEGGDDAFAVVPPYMRS
jgi:hypothetical protein